MVSLDILTDYIKYGSRITDRRASINILFKFLELTLDLLSVLANQRSHLKLLFLSKRMRQCLLFQVLGMVFAICLCQKIKNEDYYDECD